MSRANYSVSLNELNFFRVGVRIMSVAGVSFKGDNILFSLMTNLSPSVLRLMPPQPQHPDWYPSITKYLSGSLSAKILSDERKVALKRSISEYSGPFSQTLVFTPESIVLICNKLDKSHKPK